MREFPVRRIVGLVGLVGLVGHSGAPPGAKLHNSRSHTVRLSPQKIIKLMPATQKEGVAADYFGIPEI